VVVIVVVVLLLVVVLLTPPLPPQTRSTESALKTTEMDLIELRQSHHQLQADYERLLVEVGKVKVLQVRWRRSGGGGGRKG